MSKKADEINDEIDADEAERQKQHLVPKQGPPRDDPQRGEPGEVYQRDDPRDDPKTFADKRPVPPGFVSSHPTGQIDHPGQLNRDNVNPNIPSAPPGGGGIVDPARWGESRVVGGRVAVEEGGSVQPPSEPVATAGGKPAFPFSASLNEPQTVSTPIPPNIEVPVPKITSIAPTECTLGDDNFTLDVTGENFFADSVINFAGRDEPTSFDDTDTLSTGIDMAVWQGPDTVQVVVKNGPKISNAVEFTFHAPAARKGKK